jgi:hypothetical protein
MKLEHEFYKLPLSFDVETLRKELAQFTEQDWRGHPSDYEGNLAIPLVSVKGEINNIFAGPMQKTHFLKKTPYMKQVISTFKSVTGRSRLMRLEPGSEVPIHSDTNYHWHNRVRIHVPINTTPDVIFYCGDQQVHMAPGEAWIFDSWKIHKVVNPSDKVRVHLVIDTAGSPEFWDLCKLATVNSSTPCKQVSTESKLISFEKNKKSDFQLEKFNIPLVMSPGELEALVDDILHEANSFAENNADTLDKFNVLCGHLKQEWRSIWSLHGFGRSGWSSYENLLNITVENIHSIDQLHVSNHCDARDILYARVLKSAFHPELEEYYIPTQKIEEKSNINTANKSKKVGRNDPCPCGSEKKYKKCHGS